MDFDLGRNSVHPVAVTFLDVNARGPSSDLTIGGSCKFTWIASLFGNALRAAFNNSVCHAAQRDTLLTGKSISPPMACLKFNSGGVAVLLLPLAFAFAPSFGRIIISVLGGGCPFGRLSLSSSSFSHWRC